MKIYKLGSDYAYQQRLKRETKNGQHVKSQFKSASKIKPTDNVADQLQTGGETAVAAVDSKTSTEANNDRSETKKATKKKKEKEENCDSESPEC